MQKDYKKKLELGLSALADPGVSGKFISKAKVANLYQFQGDGWLSGRRVV